jgi:hypothetical protein
LEIAMSEFDYFGEAELFPPRVRKGVRNALRYKRFAHAAEAIRFAVEELPPAVLIGAHLQVDEQRYDAAGIRSLYEDAAFPLEKRRA